MKEKLIRGATWNWFSMNCFCDLDQIERRIDRIKAGKPSKVNQEELVLLQKLKNTLGGNRFLPWNCHHRKSSGETTASNGETICGGGEC